MATDSLTLSAPHKPIALIVLGMHRSGTSVFTGTLGALGVELGLGRYFYEANAHNLKGYWEYRPLVGAHGALLRSLGSMLDDYLPLPQGWENLPACQAYHMDFLHLIWEGFGKKKLWAFKDPRTCRLLPMWHTLLPKLGIQGRFPLIVRDPAEISASWIARDPRESFPKCTLLTLTHQLQMERYTRGHPRAVLTYDQLMSDPYSALQRIGAELQVRWPVPLESAKEGISRLIDPALRHHRGVDPAKSEKLLIEKGTDPQIARWAMQVYQLLAGAAGSMPAETALANARPELDRISAEFNRLAPAYFHLRPFGAPWWLSEAAESFGRDCTAVAGHGPVLERAVQNASFISP